MAQRRQSDFLAEIDNNLAGIRGLIAQAMVKETGLSRPQLNSIKDKIASAHKVAQAQIKQRKDK